MPAIPFKEVSPTIGKDVFIAPTAWVTGDVIIGDNVSFFFGATARGDINQVRIGNGTNLQEQVLLHTSTGRSDCVIGENVTVGHAAIIHGCEIGDECLIGMGAIILDDAVIGKNCIIGAQSLVTAGTQIPDGSLALGIPAKVVRSISDEERAEIQENARHYIEVSGEYRKQL